MPTSGPAPIIGWRFSEPYILSHGNPYGKDSFPPSEILRRMLLAATYGATPSIAVSQPDHLQQHLFDNMDELQRRKEWLIRKEPERWAAIVMSDNTRNFYGRSAGLVEERYLASVFGTFRACVEEHLPVTVINDWNLNDEDLARYRVLILPNTACLDDRQVAAVRKFVSRGGGLVASLDASLFDEFGNPRDKLCARGSLRGRLSRIADDDSRDSGGTRRQLRQIDRPRLLGEAEECVRLRQDVTSFLNQARMRTYVNDQPVNLQRPRNQGSVPVRSSGFPRGFASRLLQMPRFSCGRHSEVRSGSVVYFAAGLDAGYYSYAYPYQRLTIKHASKWAANDNAPVQVTAPMCVIAR